MKALVMLKSCGCVWGIETSTKRSSVASFLRVAQAANREVVTMDHAEARARLFVCEHEEERCPTAPLEHDRVVCDDPFPT